MKFLIKFTFRREGEVSDGEFCVWAEDVRYALRLVELDLDVLGAKVISVMPIDNNEKVQKS